MAVNFTPILKLALDVHGHKGIRESFKRNMKIIEALFVSQGYTATEVGLRYQVEGDSFISSFIYNMKRINKLMIELDMPGKNFSVDLKNFFGIVRTQRIFVAAMNTLDPLFGGLYRQTKITKLMAGGAYYNPFIDTKNIDAVVFDIPLTPETFAHPLVGDRYEYFNDMYVGVDSPNGYVLGTPIPAKTGRTFSLSGDSAAFAVDPNSGQITLANKTLIPTAGYRNVNLIVSDLGTFPIKIPVVTDSGITNSYNDRILFVDPINGLPGNSGRQPHVPKNTYDTAALGYPLNIFFKRGTTYVDAPALRLRGTAANTGTHKSYGDPALPQAVIQSQASVAFSAEYAASGQRQVTLSDLDLVGGAATTRCVNIFNMQGFTCKRVNFVSNPGGGTNAQGLAASGPCTDVQVKYCNFADGIKGDMVYMTQSSRIEVGFCRFGRSEGGTADCIQITGENNPSQRCADVWLHNCIMQRPTVTTTNKGAIVPQESIRTLVEGNVIVEGGYFGIGAQGNYLTARNNVVHRSRSSANNSWGIGMGADQSAHTHHFYDNIVGDSDRGYIISGFSAPSGGWDRGDISMNDNIVTDCYAAIRTTEPYTGVMENNLFIDNTIQGVESVGNGNNLATNTGSGTVSYANGVVTFTMTAPVTAHQLQTGDTVIFTNGPEAAYNGTFIVSKADAQKVVYTPASAPTITSGTASFEQYFEFKTKVYRNNVAQKNVGVGTPPRGVFTVSGQAKEGQTLTVNAPALPAGITVSEISARIDGRRVGTGPTFTIPTGASSVPNRYRPAFKNLNVPEISFDILLTDGVHYFKKRAVFPSKKLYEPITV